MQNKWTQNADLELHKRKKTTISMMCKQHDENVFNSISYNTYKDI